MFLIAVMRDVCHCLIVMDCENVKYLIRAASCELEMGLMCVSDAHSSPVSVCFSALS